MADGAVGTDGVRTGGGGRALGIAAVVVAAALQLVVLVPFTVSSGLVAPLWAVLVLYALWVAAVVVLVRVARRQPLAAPLVPLANGALWWLAMAPDGALLGWTP